MTGWVQVSRPRTVSTCATHPKGRGLSEGVPEKFPTQPCTVASYPAIPSGEGHLRAGQTTLTGTLGVGWVTQGPVDSGRENGARVPASQVEQLVGRGCDQHFPETPTQPSCALQAQP